MHAILGFILNRERQEHIAMESEMANESVITFAIKQQATATPQSFPANAKATLAAARHRPGAWAGIYRCPQFHWKGQINGLATFEVSS